MEKILESAWALFVAIGWFFINRITAKVDALENDRRLDGIDDQSVSRPEFKADIGALHIRANELERSKEDKVQDIRIIEKAKGK